MSFPFDASTKYLFEEYAADWTWLIGVDPEIPVDVLNSDLSTVSAAADRVFLIRDEQPWIMHIEIQSSSDSNLDQRIMLYNSLLLDRHKTEVRSVVVLLHPRADSPRFNGHLTRHYSNGDPYFTFHYLPIRLWQMKPEELMQGGIGLVPLVPLTNVSESELPVLLDQIRTRLKNEVEPEQIPKIWTALYVLAGLRWSGVIVNRLFQGATFVRESSTFQLIFGEGRQEGLEEGLEKGREEVLEMACRACRATILSLGSRFLGEPSETVRGKLSAVADINALHSVASQIPDFKSWDQLAARLN